MCSDYYGRTGLALGRVGPPEVVQASIARNFWSLLLAAPEDVADFRQDVFHPGACVWHRYGCRDGEPYLEERTGPPGAESE